MSDRPSDLQALFAEMKRRRVFRVMAVYGAVAFVVLQVADIAFEPLGLPPWTVTFVVLLAILGFPVAVVLAWAFEQTPEGIRRTEKAAPEEIEAIVAQPRSRRWPAGIAALAGIALLVGGAWWMGQRAGASAAGERGAAATAEPAVGSVTSAAALDPRKLAVLPFHNLAGADDAAFAQGVHDDILTRLQRVRTLKVVTRLAVQEFADTELDIDEIASRLGARYLLTGTVQRAGDRLRINVQLTDAATDEISWTGQFDETWSVATLFDVQSRIAEQVADELRVTLTEAERDAIARNSTESLEAYDLMLRAERVYNSGFDAELLSRAVELARRSVDVDPAFGLGWAMLAMAHAALYHEAYDRTDARLAAARAAIDTALALEPDLPEAHTALGFYHYWGFLDYESALDEFAIAERIAPSSRWVLTGIGAVRRRQGRMEEALRYFQRARELQPNQNTAVSAVGMTLYLMRHYEEAWRVFDELLEMPGIDGTIASNAALVRLNRDGSPAAAREIIRQARRRGLEGESLDQVAFRIEMVDRDAEAALEVVEDAGPLIANLQYYYHPRELLRGQALRLAGDSAAARAAFLAAVDVLEAAKVEMPDDERVAGALGLAYAGLGRRDEAIAEGTRATELMPIEREAWRGAIRLGELARVYADLGDADAALPIIRRLLDAPGELSETVLRLDPAFDPIRDHPGFDELTERRL